MNIIGKQTGQMIIDKLDVLSQIAVDRQYALQSELWKPFKQVGVSKSLRDAGYHFSYLAESLAANDPSLFLDYITWVKVLFTGLKLPSEALTVALQCSNQALIETLPPDMTALTQSYIDAALQHLSKSPGGLESFILAGSPMYELATHYLNLLLRGDRHLAGQLILDAVNHGIGVREIYLQVFQPCQQEVGRLWQMNQISVAQEHFCSIVTQTIMSQLMPFIISKVKTGHRLVATSVGGELHEIGMRMVADFLEMDGWYTYYLGASTPTESIVRTLQEHKADILAISATLTLHVSKVAELIDKVHSSSIYPPVKILVGGYPFNIASDLWQQVGADGYARDAADAVSVARRLVQDPA